MIRNLDYIRSLATPELPDLGSRLYEALSDIDSHLSSVAQQTNSNRTGQPLPPPSIDSLTVTGQNGHFHVQIQHHAKFYRGIQYYAEFSDNAGFQSPRAIAMGDSREITQFLGNGTYYWRAYAAYPGSAPSSPAYHGGAGSPQPVSGGGSIGGPAFLAPQGSGTGTPGQGLSGPGPVAFRSSNGKPPVRGNPPKAPTAGGGTLGSLPPSPATGLPTGGSASSGGGGASSSLITVQDVTVSSSSNTVNPPTGGLLWIVFIIQSASSPTSTITWGASVALASSNVDPTISSTTPFVFAWDSASSVWKMVVEGGTAMS